MVRERPLIASNPDMPGKNNHSLHPRTGPARSVALPTLRPSLAVLQIGLLCLLTAWLPLSVRALPPAEIDLLYFRAKPQDSGVLLEWETGSEVDNGGFELYRSQSADDTGALLEFFAPRGDLAGAYYSYQDNDVVTGTTYYYTLLSFDLSSRSETHGPAVVVAGATPTPTSTSMSTNTPTQPPTQTPTATPVPTSAVQAATSTPLPTTALAADTPVPATPSPTPPAADTPTSAPVTATLPPSPTPSAIDTLPGSAGAPSQQEPATSSSPTPELQAAPGSTAPGVDAAAQATASAPTPDSLALAAPAGASEPASELPPRAPRPTDRPPTQDGPSQSGLLATIAIGSLAAALLVIAAMVVLVLRARG